MKFRQFEFRIFPRFKGKKKKKQRFNTTASNSNCSIDDNYNYPTNDDNSLADQTANVPCGNSLEQLQPNIANFDQCNYFSYTNCFPAELSIKVPSFCCGCEQCSSGNLHSTSTSLPSAPLILLSDVDDPERTPHTIPKTRSRIKTNPWIPSPRSTPSSSPTGTVDSIGYSASDEDDHVEFEYIRGEFCSSEQSNHGTKATVVNSFEDDKLLKPRQKIIRECLRLTNLNNTNKRFSLTEFLRYDSDPAGDSPTCDKCDVINSLRYSVSFEYEEEVDSQLENHVIPRDGTFLSIKELMNDENDVKSDFGSSNKVEEQNELQQSISDDELHKTDYAMDTSFCSDEGKSFADLTFYDEGYMQASIDTGYASVSREGDLYSEDDVEFESTHDELEWDDEPSIHNLNCFSLASGSSCDEQPSYQEEIWKSDSTFASPIKECESAIKKDSPIERSSERNVPKMSNARVFEKRRSRSLAEIECSLEEKVFQLREEKLFVQQKIIEAQEEEKIRQQQLLRFTAQTGLHRKEMLLQTLNDLRERLESQSRRLQTSYDTVLSMQKRFSARRKTLPFIETLL